LTVQSILVTHARSLPAPCADIIGTHWLPAVHMTAVGM
jgi:hypothetical protein